MSAQTMQIGNRPCRIYGEAHAEYLLFQMTGELFRKKSVGNISLIINVSSLKYTKCSLNPEILCKFNSIG